jgi:hypothetical protein
VGAANVVRVYTCWGQLGHQPFRIYAYMALRARDDDSQPWYGAGHKELATIALALPYGTEQERAAATRAVRRGIAALQDAGAIRTVRYPSPGHQARYRLYLDTPTQDGDRPVNDGQRPVDNPLTEDGDRPVNNPGTQDGQRPVNELFTGRSASERRTFSVRTQDAQRPPEEEEEEEEQRTSKANLRNGEVWKAPPVDEREPSGNHVNGTIPTTPATAGEWAAWRAEARRRIDATQDGTP